MTTIESTIKNAITLSKESPVEQIKAYFKGILKLSQSAEEFPVDLDDVWGLAYSTKGNVWRYRNPILFVPNRNVGFPRPTSCAF